MVDNWAKWDAEHGRGGGGERSADKLADMIKKTVGNHEGTRATVHEHGSGGSVVHKSTKSDFKRATQPKGHKDSADSARTKIRMAAHYRGKAGGEETVKVPSKAPTEKPRSADKLAAKIEPPTRDGMSAMKDIRRREQANNITLDQAERERNQVKKAYQDQRAKAQLASIESGPGHGGSHKEAAREQMKAAVMSTTASQRAVHAKKVEEHNARAAEGGVAPDREKAARHYTMVAERAQTASKTAKTADEHNAAAEANRRAAELAPDQAHRTAHEKLASTHDRMADLAGKQEASRLQAGKVREQEARDRAAKSAADTEAAKARVAARSADKLTAARDKKAADDYTAARKDAIGAEARADSSGAAADHHAAAAAHTRAASMATTKAQRDMHHARAAAQSAKATGPADMHEADAQVSKDRAATAKTAALTGQNVHKALEGVGLQRPLKSTVSRDHTGRVVQTLSGRMAGGYDVSNNSDGTYRVNVHMGGSGTYGPSDRDRAQHEANITKATEALKAKGWNVEPGSTGMRGHLEVSKEARA